jgi:hypothetical protein
VRLPDDNPLLVNFEAGEATLIADIDLQDYTKVPNARALGPAVPAGVSYEVRWSGPISRDINVQDTDHGFRGRFLENKATLAFRRPRPGLSSSRIQQTPRPASSPNSAASPTASFSKPSQRRSTFLRAR